MFLPTVQAMFGFSAALIGEISTGKGILGQVALESGLPQSYVEVGLADQLSIGAMIRQLSQQVKGRVIA